MPAATRERRPLRRLFLAYAVLLAASHLVWSLRGAPEPSSAASRTVEVAPTEGEPVEIACAVSPERVAAGLAEGRGVPDDRPLVVLLHGSPGSSGDFDHPAWRPEGRAVVVPDLPGFGRSQRDVPDYSIRAHARYVLALADALGANELHLVGFSMGGGVALEVAGLAPARVRSIALVSAIGVQELELFGDHDLNHLVHGVQLAALRIGPWLVPHFGAWNGSLLGVPYARNFHDTDQRPLRGILERYEAPLLVVHGEHDFLVPKEAALEHHRIVPQSELALLDTGHFFLFQDPREAAARVWDFVERVERGEAVRRAGAAPERVAASLAPFDPAGLPPFAGPALLVLLVLLALATLVSEDLTCIAAGLLVAQGRVSFVAASLACFAGIFAGDVLLYLAGRVLGRAALVRRPLSWFVTPAAVERATEWFRTRGGRAIFLARFVPGFRLPTYVAAGILGQGLFAFSFYFVIAGLLWTPLLVGFSSWAGAEAFAVFGQFERWAVPGVLAFVAGILLLQRLVVPLFTYRGRRMLVGRWKRFVRWEFWPPFVFYPPVVLWVLWLALRHRSLALVTAVNPGIPTGGFIGESKSAILSALGDDEGRVARFVALRTSTSEAERVAAGRAFVGDPAQGLPVVLKPDVGQRGSGVRVLRDAASLDAALRVMRVDSILQQFVPGEEYGLFWVHLPSEERGRIFSITKKVLPTLIGDGRRTLEELILDDRRAVALARVYLDANAGHTMEVVGAGEARRLVELGTHCRGAIFLDGAALRTEALEEATFRLGRRFEGFYFGRYDVIADGPEALARGEFRAIELNGLTSEATHVYDPRHGLLEAYRVLFEQWRLAFRIARECRERGARPTPLGTLVREVLAYRRLQAAHGAVGPAEDAVERAN